MDKDLLYADLVQKRKACTRCMASGADQDIVNPSCSRYDAAEIGQWSVWQANLDADILIIGQDWGDYPGFFECNGEDSDTNPTNRNLQKLLESIGVLIDSPTEKDGRNGSIFLTNAILCLKNSNEGMQAEIKKEWVQNCGQVFLRPLIDLVNPKIVISLGSWAYLSMRNLYNLGRHSFKSQISEYTSPNFTPIRLPNHSCYFPMYHCGRRVVNSQKGLDKQILLWSRVKPYCST